MKGVAPAGKDVIHFPRVCTGHVTLHEIYFQTTRQKHGSSVSVLFLSAFVTILLKKYTVKSEVCSIFTSSAKISKFTDIIDSKIYSKFIGGLDTYQAILWLF